MRHGKASRTALRVAIRRAAHQLVDHPPVLADPIALRLIGTNYPRDLERASHTVARDFRAYLAARSRFAEDHLARAVSAGVRQYVILGAGLDTFAYRNPFPTLHVFEADFPATQQDKREMLAAARIEVPDNLTFVALDFEHKTLLESLAEGGFDAEAPAFCSWLGVVPYLTIDAFRATLAAVGSLPAGTGLALDYSLPPETLTAERRAIFDRLAGRVAAAGEPLRLFFTPGQMQEELHGAGFREIEQVDHEGINALYFHSRTDGLRLSPVRIGVVAAAWK
jgi:methyltransferase (TIGR00027 family)